MSVLRTGSSTKFSNNWDNIFSSKKSNSKKSGAQSKAKKASTAKKRPAKKKGK